MSITAGSIESDVAKIGGVVHGLLRVPGCSPPSFDPSVHSEPVVDAAHTNVALYNQLRSAGWAPGQLESVRDAYLLAVELFAGQCRPSGTLQVSHLVGTASIAAGADDRPTLVAAALVHAAYLLGDFGDGARGPGREHRAKVRDAIGEAAEAIVADYAALPWRHDQIVDLGRRAASLTPRERDVVLIKIANELEDYLDLGLSYAAVPLESYQQNRPPASIAVLAERLGWPRLAADLLEAADANAAADIPAVLRGP
jgi:(p)ppGpp synthase/HD superfamily hydrolase